MDKSDLVHDCSKIQFSVPALAKYAVFAHRAAVDNKHPSISLSCKNLTPNIVLCMELTTNISPTCVESS